VCSCKGDSNVAYAAARCAAIGQGCIWLRGVWQYNICGYEVHGHIGYATGRGLAI